MAKRKKKQVAADFRYDTGEARVPCEGLAAGERSGRLPREWARWAETPVRSGRRGAARDEADADAGSAGWIRRLLEGKGSVVVDDLIAASGRPTPEVLRGLVVLELEGGLERMAAGRVRLTGGR